MTVSTRRSLVFLLLAGALARAGEPPKVGVLGDPRRIVLEGNATFTADAIVDGICSDLDVIEAAHPRPGQGLSGAGSGRQVVL